MILPTGVCPCGCGQPVPVSVGNIWKHGIPYWAWYCTMAGCERFQVEQRNQSGDGECPWCGHPRQFVGHMAHRTHGGRVTVTGDFVPSPEHTATRYFRPYKSEGSLYGS